MRRAGASSFSCSSSTDEGNAEEEAEPAGHVVLVRARMMPFVSWASHGLEATPGLHPPHTFGSLIFDLREMDPQTLARAPAAPRFKPELLPLLQITCYTTTSRNRFFILATPVSRSSSRVARRWVPDHQLFCFGALDLLTARKHTPPPICAYMQESPGGLTAQATGSH